MVDPAARLRAALGTIASSWDDTLEPARRAQESHAVTRLANPPLPIDAATLDTRATCHERLAWWSRMVISTQHLHLLPAIDVPALCRFLLIHADWLADSTHGPKALAEMENSAAKLGTIAARNAPKHMDVGACPGSNNGRPCTGLVQATVRADDDLLPSELRCDGTPAHVWPSGEWRILNRRMHRDASAARRETEARRSGMNTDAMNRLVAAIAAPNRP